MKRNPKQMMAQLQGCMCASAVSMCAAAAVVSPFVLCRDPRMMQQLGGQENLMTMMKEMNKMDLNSMFPGLK